MDNDIKPPVRQSSSEPAVTEPETSQNENLADTDLFRTPEAIAAEQDSTELSETKPPILDNEKLPDHKSHTNWTQRFALHWPPKRKEWLVLAGILALAGGATSALLLTQHPKKTVVHHGVKHHVVKPPIPTIVPSTLTGLPVAPAINKLPVTAVMIENSMAARPQSGLSQAGVIFEAIAEGGITRFLTLFQDTAPDDVGPIRSARPYYIQWALGFDAGYAHVGGSPEALDDIRAWGVRDLDQFANSDSYHRIDSRAAPHNVYTGIATLQQLEAAKGYTSSNFTGFVRKKKEAPSKQPTAKSIDISISGDLYNVHYDYIAATNSYNRSEGGAPHTDANGNVQISPKVVIALVMSYGLEADDHHSQYGTIGSGPVSIFQDGVVATGQWAKASEKDQFIFTDAAGKPITLNAGQTWLTAIADSGGVTSAP